MDIKSSDQVVTSVNSANLTNFQGSSYKFISIKEQTLFFIPQALGNFFQEAEGFEVAYSGLKKIQKKDIAQFPKLIELWLYGTKLRSLPSDLFEGNPELKSLHLYRNRIKTIGQNILAPLKNLLMINLESNSCIDYSASGLSEIKSIIDEIHSNCSDQSCDNCTVKIEGLEAKLKSLEENLQMAISRIAKMEEKFYVQP